MDIGMTLPVMEPDVSLENLAQWAQTIDEAGFSSLAFGERMAFGNPEAFTLLGAVTAWTRRVRIATTIVVPQLHDPVMLAKAMATGDVLSNGRLSVGVGVGGRDEDYRAAGADPATKTMQEMADRVEVMRRVWRGENVTGATRSVGPTPVQPGGPEILVGTMGPKTIRHASHWADGIAGVTLDLNVDAVAELFALARTSWAQAGRPGPRLTTSFWFAVGDEPREQIHRHLRHYMNWIPVEFVDAMAPTTGFAGTLAELDAVLDEFAAIGTEEIQLIPTSSDHEQLLAVADLVARRR